MKLYKTPHTEYKTKISYCLGHTLSEEDSGHRRKKLSENKASGNQLYMVIPPKYAISKVVETIKKNTSRSLSRKFVFLKKVYWDRKGV